MELERKTFPFRLKADGPEGSFKAVFATFDVVDHDGDVTRPGAFKAGAPVIVGSWGHKTYDLPVGKGAIVADQREVAVEGQFFLDTGPGKDTYQTVKNLGELGEWSYVFSVMKQSFGEFEGRQVRFLEDIKVYSVDPVLAGAGVDTRTSYVKGREMPFAEHTEEVAERVAEFVARVKERTAVREKEGRVLSTANVERLAGMAESLKASAVELEKLLETAEPKGDELLRQVQRARFILAGLPAAR